ncbi:hypothetical protein JTM43_34050, partial [Pseudomonas aeruginosa]|nr:hypothetical protein [Pseudomonas aeruginosa]
STGAADRSAPTASQPLRNPAGEKRESPWYSPPLTVKNSDYGANITDSQYQAKSATKNGII